MTLGVARRIPVHRDSHEVCVEASDRISEVEEAAPIRHTFATKQNPEMLNRETRRPSIRAEERARSDCAEQHLHRPPLEVFTLELMGADFPARAGLANHPMELAHRVVQPRQLIVVPGAEDP